MVLCIFFFSSRRRHTRSKRDWSSDVCSSDLPQSKAFLQILLYIPSGLLQRKTFGPYSENNPQPAAIPKLLPVYARSEERRVGKERKSEWWKDHSKNNKQVVKVTRH